MTDAVAIIDYGSGNLRSAAKAVEHVAVQAGLDFRVVITHHADEVAAARHIILPGQGAFGDCMDGLRRVDGMIEALNDAVLKKGIPFLGVCVGMQLLADRGFEHGAHDGLGWIGGDVAAMQPDNPTLKIPHMGWNDVTLSSSGGDHPVLQSITKSSSQNCSNFYFVHSFVFNCKDPSHVLATTHYGGIVNAVVGKENIVGVQFHPEKSQDAGLELIKNFVCWTP